MLRAGVVTKYTVACGAILYEGSVAEKLERCAHLQSGGLNFKSHHNRLLDLCSKSSITFLNSQLVYFLTVGVFNPLFI